MNVPSGSPVPSSDRFARVAGPVHTIVVLALLAAWASLGAILSGHARASAVPHRVPMYLGTIAMEWIVFAIVLAGVRSSGAPLTAVLGERWASARQLWQDIGIAAGFWVASSIGLVLVTHLLRVGEQENARLQFMLPRGAVELTLWVLMSITAGICEETIFRGYLQRQLLAFTRNAAAGILLSAIAFGAAHAYQGWRMVIVISIYGAMFGALAYWRRTPRPGMMAHAWQDTLGGVVSMLMRH
jgi:membrane protease YdiL (CAAX protease family)